MAIDNSSVYAEHGLAIWCEVSWYGLGRCSVCGCFVLLGVWILPKICKIISVLFCDVALGFSFVHFHLSCCYNKFLMSHSTFRVGASLVLKWWPIYPQSTGSPVAPTAKFCWGSNTYNWKFSPLPGCWAQPDINPQAPLKNSTKVVLIFTNLLVNPSLYY